MHPSDFQPMDSGKPIDRRIGTFLPHWQQDGATYAVTFRLADSLPRAAVERLANERRTLEKELQMTGALADSDEYRRLATLHSEKFEALLDQCSGECVLRKPEAAAAVVSAMKHFDGVRYKLFAFCVMPNHCHVVFKPLGGHDLQQILGSRKSQSAKQINALLRRSGNLWQEESYDHLLRNGQEFDHAVKYVLSNPVKAGLTNWPWVYLAPELHAAAAGLI